MNQSIYTGTSGLVAFQNAIGVESNNVSNVNTVGFKSDTVSFGDLIYQGNVGKGVNQNDPFKNFSQGQLKPSNSEYDFAISGEGFFTLQDPDTPGKLFYSRTGQFASNKDNFLSNSTGLVVMGLRPVVSGDIITSEYGTNISSTTVDSDKSTYTLNTYVTNYKNAAKEIQNVLNNFDAITAYNAGTATQNQKDLIESNPSLIPNSIKYATEIANLQSATSGNNHKSVNAILDDISEIISNYTNALTAFSVNPVAGTAATKAETAVTFPKIIGADNKYTLELFVDGTKIQQEFDTSVENTLKLFSDKINGLSGVTSSIDTVTGELSINSLVSGKKMVVSKVKLNDQTLAIDEKVKAEGSGESLVNALYQDLELALSKVGGKAANNKSEILDTPTGQAPAFESILLDLNALGMSTILSEKLTNGDPTSVASYPSIESEDGNIYLTDGNARFLVGKILPVTFTNMGELNPQGDNLYTKGVNQSDPMYVENGAEVMGKYLENSNIDLSDTLVNLMVWQKAFDANSKSVTTSDELLKTALALKSK